MENLALLYETTVVSTDREYYYPGEFVWFKVSMLYRSSDLRDSLSKVAYVELLNMAGQLVSTSRLPIINSGAQGHFLLPRSMTPGVYGVRAYTQWMLNFKNPVQTKPLLVLNHLENLKCDSSRSPNATNHLLSVNTEKEIYACREKVRLQIKLNSVAPGTANLSVSVVDSYSCRQINGGSDIYQQARAASAAPKAISLEHSVEKGISIYGVLKEQKTGPATSSVMIMQSQLGLWESIAPRNGTIALTGLSFYDSLPFVFSCASRKGKPAGEIEIVKHTRPVSVPVDQGFPTETIQSNAHQRVANSYIPDTVITMLSEVVVKGKALEEREEKRVKLGALYDHPDFVINGDDLQAKAAGENWVSALDGKIPGFQGGKVSRAKNSSFTGNTQPLVLVDGVPLNVPLGSIPVAAIDRVEIVKNVSSIYGSRGSNGIIAVYTKATGTSYSKESAQAAKPNVKMIEGYTRPQKFPAPNHANDPGAKPDFRITLHWEPYLTFDDSNMANIDFFSADLSTNYVITIEGFIDGYPVKLAKEIRVECTDR